MVRAQAGAIFWTHRGSDPLSPTDDEKKRPVVIMRHADHPYGATECAVVCLGTDGHKYDQSTPELKYNKHYTGTKLNRDTYLLPWALRTIPPGAIQMGSVPRKLTKKGTKLLLRELAMPF